MSTAAKAKKPFKSKTSSSSSLSFLTAPSSVMIASGNTPTTAPSNNIITTPTSNISGAKSTNQTSTLLAQRFIQSLGIEELSNNTLIPKDLFNFCEQLFMKCLHDRDKKFVEQYLSSLIKKHVGNDTLLSTDWESIPLPDLPSSWNTTSNALKESSSTASTTAVDTLPKIPKITKKRTLEEIVAPNGDPSKNSATVSSSNSGGTTMFLQATKPSSFVKNPNALSKPVSFLLQKNTQSSYINPSSSINAANNLNRESLEALFRKLDKIKKKKATMNKQATPPPHKKMKVASSFAKSGFVGTMEALEKQYLRTSSELKPEDFRPFHILQKSLPFVVSKYERGEVTYDDYLCEQMKAIRQDLTVQGIENEFTVLVYETHARIAIKNKDISEFNQCQTRLKDLYSKGLKGNREEFLMYNIMYLTLNDSTSELTKVLRIVLSDTKSNFKTHEYVKFGLDVHSSYSVFNFFKLFNVLYNKAPKSGKSMIDMFADAIRRRALLALCKAHSPVTLNRDFVEHSLGLSINHKRNESNFSKNWVLFSLLPTRMKLIAKRLWNTF
ncbi:hypothetical protein C9374_004575 [Naegleria lovaniensis]|uniref:SAC3/GANP/THP3 conserved domain-containing protein n=1 Tax=Naegleria lovaniensis TaxID=51637 RepID=A0AA88KKP4_NAELO|nr:uncharacterized protein C9374_004575 [Naegleria lovaniensis]KAG2383238.1 hypothetical protein C9374_004575 [Naegleria lovaniensis]